VVADSRSGKRLHQAATLGNIQVGVDHDPAEGCQQTGLERLTDLPFSASDERSSLQALARIPASKSTVVMREQMQQFLDRALDLHLTQVRRAPKHGERRGGRRGRLNAKHKILTALLSSTRRSIAST